MLENHRTGPCNRGSSYCYLLIKTLCRCESLHDTQLDCRHVSFCNSTHIVTLDIITAQKSNSTCAAEPSEGEILI